MADEVVEYLVANWSEAEIVAAQTQVFTAHLAGLESPTVITSSTFEGGSASGTITVQAGGREAFLRQCRMAIARLDGNASSMSTGLQVRWDQRRTET